MASSLPYSLLVLVSCIAAFSSPSEAHSYPPVAPGLNFTFYESSCPNLETLVRNYLKNAFSTNIGLAAGLLRIQLHDCFVQGCDASVLLDGSASMPSEKDALPNLTLRPAAFKAINDIKALVTQACGNVVSCADVIGLAARDSVYLSGGPDYGVPLGRRDSLTFASQATTLTSFPPPTTNVTGLLTIFSKYNFDKNDLVALSGGHTIGIGHCTSFQNRLFPTQDPTMDNTFAKKLYLTCPVKNTTNSTVLDVRSPNRFDNKYFVDLMNRQGLFTSDQDLYSDCRTRDIVTSFAMNQKLFFEQFVYSITKMGQLGVLTGSQGQIRADCSVANPGPTELLWPVADDKGERGASSEE